jgi:hypothetical protein
MGDRGCYDKSALMIELLATIHGDGDYNPRCCAIRAAAATNVFASLPLCALALSLKFLPIANSQSPASAFVQ